MSKSSVGTDGHPNNTCDSGRASLPASLHQQCNKTTRHPSSAGQNQSPPATTIVLHPMWSSFLVPCTWSPSARHQKIRSPLHAKPEGGKQGAQKPPAVPIQMRKNIQSFFLTVSGTLTRALAVGKLSQPITCPRCHKRISTRPHDMLTKYFRTGQVGNEGKQVQLVSGRYMIF
jgi:hypothetical protein